MFKSVKGSVKIAAQHLEHLPLYLSTAFKLNPENTEHIITGAQPKAGTGHKVQTVSVVFSTLHCEGYTADLRYIAGSLLFWSLKSYPPF